MNKILVDEDEYLELLGRAARNDELEERIVALERRIERLDGAKCKSQKEQVLEILYGLENGLPLTKIFSLMKLNGKGPAKKTARSKLKRALTNDERFKCYDHPKTLKLFVKVVTGNR